MNTIIAEPTKPECFTTGKPITQYTEDDHRQMAAYHAKRRQADALFAQRGRAVTPETVAELTEDAHKELMAWLKENGAPAEIITLAEWLPDAENVRTRYQVNWRKLDDYAAATVGKFVPALKTALSRIRKARRTGKGQ